MLYTNEAIEERKIRANSIKGKINIIITILLIPLLIYNLTLIIQAVVNPNETPTFFGIKMYVIISGSMKPELDVGDIVIVKEIQENELKEGDIISFRRGQSVITHRISGILITDNGIEYRTKGDNNNVEDTETVNQAQIEGKVVKKISSIGKIVLMLKNEIIIILIVLFYYVYLMKEQSINKRRKLRKIKRIEYETKKNKEKKDEENRA